MLTNLHNVLQYMYMVHVFTIGCVSNKMMHKRSVLCRHSTSLDIQIEIIKRLVYW